MTDGGIDVPWASLRDEVARFVHRRIADHHAADDLVQDVLARAAKALAAHRPAGPLRAWVLTIARNAVIDHYRTGKLRALPNDDAVAAATVEPGVDREGLLASFRAFLHALPPEQREAVLLTEYEGLTQPDVAERLGVPLSTVKSRVQRGKQRLEQALHDCCEFEFDRRGHVVDWTKRPDSDCRDC